MVAFQTIISILIIFSEVKTVSLQNVLIGLIFAGVIAMVSYRVKFLTLSGTIATFILAGFIFSLGGIKWSVPILTFFVLSSILSKLRKKKNEEVEIYFEKSGIRDYQQVIANGGLGGVLVILDTVYPNELFYLIYLAILSAVCSDTWATEIGTWKKTITYNILNLEQVEQGISGGISIRGLIGSLFGALAIMSSGILWIDIPYIQYVILIVLAGIFGSLFDSVLGATIQAQNKCNICYKVIEKKIHCGTKANHFRGYKWISNDIVNLFSGIAGAVFLVIIKSLI